MNFNLTNTRGRLSRLHRQSQRKAKAEHEPDYAAGYRAGLRDAVEAIRLEVDADEALLRKRHSDDEMSRKWNDDLARYGGR